MDLKRLRIYLDDHLAMSIVEVGLARRVARSNRGTPLAAFLESHAAEAEQDRGEILILLERMGLRPSAVKQLGARLGERLGRLKLNGQLAGYSPLSRLEELEGLAMLLEARRCLWRSLEVSAADEPRITEARPAERVRHIDRQRRLLEEHRLAAARQALSQGAGADHGAR